MRRLLGRALFAVADTAAYLVYEFVIDPWRNRGFDYDAYEAAKRQDRIDLAEGL